MNKEEFINKLKIRLEEYNEEEAKNLIEYYSELIEEAVEAGKDEKEIIDKLGSIDNIMKKIEIEKKVKQVENKPTLSNGIIAIIAILGVISSPIWLTVILAVGVFLLAVFVALIAVVISIFAVILALIVTIVGAIATGLSGFTGGTIIIGAIGGIIFMIGLGMVISKFVFNTLPVGAVNLFKKIVYKVKGE